MNFDLCSILDILHYINSFKDIILIFIISLLINNNIVYNQLRSISIFNSNNQLNILAYIFQAILFTLIYIIIIFIFKFI